MSVPSSKPTRLRAKMAGWCSDVLVPLVYIAKVRNEGEDPGWKSLNKRKVIEAFIVRTLSYTGAKSPSVPVHALRREPRPFLPLLLTLGPSCVLAKLSRGISSPVEIPPRRLAKFHGDVRSWLPKAPSTFLRNFLSESSNRAIITGRNLRRNSDPVAE